MKPGDKVILISVGGYEGPPQGSVGTISIDQQNVGIEFSDTPVSIRHNGWVLVDWIGWRRQSVPWRLPNQWAVHVDALFHCKEIG